MSLARLLAVALVSLRAACGRAGGDGTPPKGNGAPVAANDQATTAKNTPVAIDVLRNDTDPDGDALDKASVATGALTNGTTALNAATGVVTFTPARFSVRPKAVRVFVPFVQTAAGRLSGGVVENPPVTVGR